MTEIENPTDTTEIEDTAHDIGIDADADTAAAESETETETSDSESDDDAETFPRPVVERLRAENARYRQRAQQADEFAGRLHTELVRATGRLADPTDLTFDPAHLDDPDALAGALDALLAAKPHLATRRVTGDVGQGHRGPASATFSLLDTLKGLT